MFSEWMIYLTAHWQAIGLWIVLIGCLISLTYAVIVRFLKLPISFSLLYWMSMATAFMFVLLAIYIFNHTVINDASQMRQVVLTLINASFLVGTAFLILGIITYLSDRFKYKQSLKGK
ncbi:hypothetical protein ACKXGF_06085 [Alkalibacillus sp. S2W]|uniref:hypothetical protein n=1 Tax=Alkalibacillus sp. S2W TaxID=3386553 RepID=UPI00398CCE42